MRPLSATLGAVFAVYFAQFSYTQAHKPSASWEPPYITHKAWEWGVESQGKGDRSIMQILLFFVYLVWDYWPNLLSQCFAAFSLPGPWCMFPYC